jgi:hypothetical protein
VANGRNKRRNGIYRGLGFMVTFVDVVNRVEYTPRCLVSAAESKL